MPTTEKILVTGASGRLGRYLADALRLKYGIDNVIAADVEAADLKMAGPFRVLNVLDKTSLLGLISEEKISTIYHLAAILPSACEKNRERAWKTNIDGLIHVLDAAKIYGLKVFWTSSISVFGAHADRVNCHQHAPARPDTIYGMTKLAAENWANYYHHTFGVDVRAIRLPGVYVPGATERGGMMDILYGALRSARAGAEYDCYLRPQTIVPAIHIEDAVRAAMELMTANNCKLFIRTAYNVHGFSFSPAALETVIRENYPGFKMKYKPDTRQAMADSWPQSLNDNAAQQEWGWEAEFKSVENYCE